jgi:hypothetical protein
MAALLAAFAIACSPETIQTTVGSGGFRLRATALQVGDTMTVDAGVWYHDGTFVRDTFARYAVTPAAVAQIGNVSGMLSANAEGTATITATLRGQITLDTTVAITP